MLSNSDDDRLVVRRRVDGAETISSCWNTSSNINIEYTIGSSIVDTLEEREPGWVSWCGLVECLQLLDDDVGVADDVALTVNSVEGRGRGLEIKSHICAEKKRNALLRRRVIVRLRIHKVTRLQVPDSHLNRKRCVRLDRVTVLWVYEFRTRHVGRARDHTNWSRVA